MQINVIDVAYIYPETPNIQVIKDLTITIPSNSLTAIVGESGSGKTTLVRLLAGLLKPQQGLIRMKSPAAAYSSNSKEYRRQVGIVFQFPEHQLFADTVFNEIAFGPRNLDLPEQEIVDRVSQSMLWMGLSSDLEGNNPLLLSGGEKRRVAIAGVLAMLPKVIILDEPTAGLDYTGRLNLFATLKLINATLGTTIIWVTHDLDEVRLYADFVCVMNQGRCLLEGKPEVIFHEPTLVGEARLELPPWYQLINSLNQKCFQGQIPKHIQDIGMLIDYIISRLGREDSI